MSDTRLFAIGPDAPHEIPVTSITVEKSLQQMIEKNPETFLGVRLLASEHSTGSTQRGRIDTLGPDENDSPVIIEYKRATNENVINQGLSYLTWLLDHRAEFQLLVQSRLGLDVSVAIEWAAPRLICLAGDFTKYDQHAVNLIDRNIELVRYRRYGSDLLLLELVDATTAKSSGSVTVGKTKGGTGLTAAEAPVNAPTPIADLYEALDAHLVALGDDVTSSWLKLYVAFKRIKNFACIEVYETRLRIYVKVDPTTVDLVDGFTRDVRNKGHHGTGDLEISLRTMTDLERAKPLLAPSYGAS